jgi:ribosomal protein L11 methylase PrmA
MTGNPNQLSPTRLDGSFRDPSGFVFARNGEIYRQINLGYKASYDLLIESGLYNELAAKELLIPHQEVDQTSEAESGSYKIVKPLKIPFISYPYEWAFSQLKDAALLTLEVQIAAIHRGMSLKDASAYNVQFIGAKPIFIDTLSFEPYTEGKAWVAYRQFCQHFLAPLSLMSYRDVALGNLALPFIDGVPLSLASKILPKRTWASFSLATHIHLHARMQSRYADSGSGGRPVKEARISKTALLGLLDNLRGIIQSFSWRPGGTEWADYYNATNYSSTAMSEKEQLVERLCHDVNPGVAWDLGANTGVFSRRAVAAGAYTVACDIDPSAVEQNYRWCRSEKLTQMLPLVIDLTNPPPAIGWAHKERYSLIERGPADLVLALALIHHLAISNHVPLPKLASFFASCGKNLIIEFVPKSDSQVQRLLSSRQDIFVNYNESEFERAFSEKFVIEARIPVPESKRILYRMRRAL